VNRLQKRRRERELRPPTHLRDVSPDELFRRYAPYVARVAMTLLGRREDVEEAVQDVFLQAFPRLAQVRDFAAFGGWIATITVRVAHRRLRKRRLLGFVGLDDGDYRELEDPAAPPDQRALLAQLYRVLDRLPTDQRIAWTLRHVEGEALDQVALSCGCSLATAKRRIRAAQIALAAEVGHG